MEIIYITSITTKVTGWYFTAKIHFPEKTPTGSGCKSAASVGRVVQKRLEHVQRRTWRPLRNHVSSTLWQNRSFKVHNRATTVRIRATTQTEMNTGGYLDSQKGEVSKLLVETSKLVIVEPGLVVGGDLGTIFFYRGRTAKSNNQTWCFKCETFTCRPRSSTNHWFPRKLHAMSVSPL